MRSTNDRKDVTIYDIAREASVSSATVSRILTGSARVSEEKRTKVLALIDKYDFKPNALARGLSETRSKLIGMLCPDVSNPYYAKLFVECEQSAFERGYTLMLNNTFTQEDKEVAFLEKMMEQRVECIILCGGLIDWSAPPKRYIRVVERIVSRIPVVVAGRTQVTGCLQVALDHSAGMKQAVRHLAALGHERIAFLCYDNTITLANEKASAFAMAMEELNLPVYPEYILSTGRFDEESGFISMNRLLSLPQPPTAVIGINDLRAAGALRAITQLGYSVPEDFALIGFDNSIVSELTTPKLTSVGYPYEAYGKQLVDTALSALSGRAVPALVLITPELVIKKSCRKL